MSWYSNSKLRRNRELYSSIWGDGSSKRRVHRGLRWKYRWTWPERLLNIEETSKIMQISVSTLYTWSSEGKFPVVKCGRAVRFDPLDIEKWIEENKRNPKYRK
jgi:excisionase family DNA binding protein